MTKKGMINITGAAEGRVAPIIADIISEEKGQSLIVVSTVNRARRLTTDLSFLVNGRYTYCRRRKRPSYSMRLGATMNFWRG